MSLVVMRKMRARGGVRVHQLREARFGLDVVDVQDVIGAEREDLFGRAVDGDAERLSARPVLVNRVCALLCQVVPEPDYT